MWCSKFHYWKADSADKQVAKSNLLKFIIFGLKKTQPQQQQQQHQQHEVGT
jgi:hypothetical protein